MVILVFWLFLVGITRQRSGRRDAIMLHSKDVRRSSGMCSFVIITGMGSGMGCLGLLWGLLLI